MIPASRPTAANQQRSQNLDSWLEEGKWDVIHSISACRPEDMKTKSNQVPLEDYEANLKSIVEKLQKTGAKVIWATTTARCRRGLSIPCGVWRRARNNAAAAKIMAERRWG